MIKNVLKYMFSLLILCLGIVNFSIGKYVDFGSPVYQFGDNTCYIGSDLSFNCTKSGITLTSYDPGYLKTVNSLFWTSDGIGFYYNYPTVQSFQGLINTGFYICSGDFTNIHSGDSVMYDNQSCDYAGTKVNVGSYDNLINLLTSKTPNLVGTFFPDSYGIILSLVYDDFYFSLYLGGRSDTYPSNGNYELKNMGFTGYDYETLAYGNNVLFYPNWIWNGNNNISQVTGNTIYNDVTSNDLISYFENSPLYGFNSQICYVGTNDLSSPYESGLAYYPGTGKTIFDLYERLYGTGEYTINKMGTFLNTWWINYFTFWENDNRDENGNPLYVAKFDGNNFWLDYQDLTSPFINNLAAIYFMASKITMYGQQSTIGEEIATYCYYKLGEIENVTDDSNQAYWNNAGNYEKQRQKNIGEYIDPSSEGTGGFRSKLGIYDNTGDKTDFASNFKNFYAKMSGKFDSVSDFNGFGIIPDYILGFLVLIVLFRILRGKGRN